MSLLMLMLDYSLPWGYPGMLRLNLAKERTNAALYKYYLSQ
jgi:hypothetical protein